MWVLDIAGYAFIYYAVGVLVTAIQDETEHTPMGWSNMMPSWIPLGIYTWLWPLTLVLSLIKFND